MKMCKCKEGSLVKILPSKGSTSNSFDGNTLSLSSISSATEMDEYVVLESHLYQDIFKKKKIDADNNHKLLSIVKICCDGKTIHRAYRSLPVENFTKQYVALSPNSIYLLSTGATLQPNSKVYLSKGCMWKFYWEHPNGAVRMSFRIGVIGIVSTLIGVNLTNICDCISWLIGHVSDII